MNRANSEIYFLIITGISVFTTMVLFVLYFVIKYQRKQKLNLIEKEKLRSEYENQLLQTQLEIQEQTMKIISQEIHDNIGQMLSLAKLNLGLANIESPGQQRLVDSHKLVSNSIQDLRDLAHSLDTDYISQMGLGRALEYELEMINKTGIIKTEMNIEGEVREIDKQKELIIFRIAQESLNNIIKHANATSLEVSLSYSSDRLALQIADDGVGLDTSLMEGGKDKILGSGIRNMRGRALLIGADFNMNSTLGKGTLITISLSN